MSFFWVTPFQRELCVEDKDKKQISGMHIDTDTGMSCMAVITVSISKIEKEVYEQLKMIWHSGMICK